MSKIIILLLITLVSLNAIEWISYDDALKLQAKNGKVIMLDVVRTDCHYCSDMDDKVFNDSGMSEWLEQRFIAVKVNLDKDKIPLDISVSFTPSFFFIDKNQVIVKKIPGAWNIADFQDLTKNIVKDKK